MTNAQALRKIINEKILDADKEALEFLDAIEEELTKKDDEIIRLENEIQELEDEPANDPEHSIDLGLDTIHFSFEKNNLVTMSQVELALRAISKIPNQEIMIN